MNCNVTAAESRVANPVSRNAFPSSPLLRRSVSNLAVPPTETLHCSNKDSIQAGASAADVEEALTLPASPRLILVGDTRHWMLSIEGQVVCEGTTFVSGLAVLFASYYNFNLQYQDEAACTLEFIQRLFIDINPERGTRAKQGKVVSKKTGREVQKKPHNVNPHVATLLRKLMDYKWDFVN